MAPETPARTWWLPPQAGLMTQGKMIPENLLDDKMFINSKIFTTRPI
jgi:hypothetical protein